jgi:PAS domain S-box-containing protein
MESIMILKHSIPSEFAKRSRKSLIEELLQMRRQLDATQAQSRQPAQESGPQLPLHASEGTGFKQDRRKTLEIIADGFFTCDDQWRFVYLNRAAENLLGIRRDDVLGKSLWEIFPFAEGTELESEYFRAANGEVRDFNYYHEPWRRWFHNRCIPREGGGLSVYFQEITERKKTEAALRQSEERFRRVFENAGMGIAITDWNGRFLQCNPAYCTLLGYTEEELKGMGFVALIHPDDRAANQTLINRLKSGNLRSFEIKNRFVHKKGHSVWVDKFVSILPNKDDDPPHLMALVNDITRSKKTKTLLSNLNRSLVERTKTAEQRAAEIQRLALEVSNAEDRERKRLAAILHDDFQQTLAYLKLRIANLHTGSGVMTNLATVNDIIDGCIQSCRNLSHELSPRVIEQKGFFGALRWLCRQMKEMHGLDTDLRSIDAPEIKPFDLAAVLIRSIRELLYNVVKHSGQKSATVRVEINQDTLEISVEDAGKGCEYDKFEKKQLKESAYGLFSIEDRIKLLGGGMQVRSQPGKGFCVTLNIPYAFSALSRRQPINVLLADDHEVMRNGLAKLLKDEADINVVGMASDGSEAVALAGQVKPDLVVMDVSMPVMNGIEATTRIKALLPGTTIIGLTMHEEPDIQQAMVDAGAYTCLTKADSPDKLVETVRSLPWDRKR